MTDRELLEKAAKAAGICTWWNGERFGPNPPSWDPLNDDGDALRLAVKLNLIVEIGADFIYAFRTDVGSEEHATSDPYAATRRAIVRAAAAIEGDQ
jgi:hypothetical protein